MSHRPARRPGHRALRRWSTNTPRPGSGSLRLLLRQGNSFSTYRSTPSPTPSAGLRCPLASRSTAVGPSIRHGLCHRQIAARFDLTLECIRRHYLSRKSPLSDVLTRYADFFNLFGTCGGYVQHFLLQDLVRNDWSVKFSLPCESSGGLPFRRPSTSTATSATVPSSETRLLNAPVPGAHELHRLRWSARAVPRTPRAAGRRASAGMAGACNALICR